MNRCGSMSFSGSMTSVIAGVSVSVAIQVSAEDLRNLSGLGQVSSEEEELADMFQRVLQEMPSTLQQARKSVFRSLLIESCKSLQNEIDAKEMTPRNDIEVQGDDPPG